MRRNTILISLAAVLWLASAVAYAVSYAHYHNTLRLVAALVAAFCSGMYFILALVNSER